MDEKKRVSVSVPICDLGSCLVFCFPTGIVVIKLPFEALGMAEEIRQEAFLVIAHYGGKVEWRYTAGDRLLTGELELNPQEIHTIANLAKMLAGTQLIEESGVRRELSR